jgi:hypothetical protein
MFFERFRRSALVLMVLSAATLPAGSTVLVTVDEALRLAFPQCEIKRETIFLTEQQLKSARALSGESVTRALTVRHVARRKGSLVGTAYFDVHLVRTLQETLLVVVKPDGTLGRVEVLSFDEPLDYLPREGWYRQFDGEALDANLQIDRAIHAVTGATLTAEAAMAAARRVLALHQVIEQPGRAE